MDSNFIENINRLASASVPFLIIIDFECLHPLLYPIARIPGDILFHTPRYRNHTPSEIPFREFRFTKHPVGYGTYKTGFDKVHKNLMAGNSYLVNLTFPTRINTDLSLKEIYYLSRAKYKLLYRDSFVVFSPETFIQITNRKISAFPMKGTIDASVPDAGKIILENEKETAEHYTIVDLLRNDLSMMAKKVRVERFRFIDELRTNQKNLLQVSSVISGELPENYKRIFGEIICSLLPAGSVSGAPKKETLRIITEAETSLRGYYTGIMGYYDGEDFDSAVMIRFMGKNGNKLYYRSGGGITSLSDPETEYQEMIDKVYVPVN